MTAATSFWTKSSLLVVSGAIIYVLAILLWGINRGFDLADEGFYLLLAKYPYQYHLITYFNVWMAHIPSFTASRILDFRYAQIACQIMSATLLSYAYLHALWKLDILRNRILIIAGGAFSILGNLLLFAKFPFSLSYNSLTALVLFGATALIIEATPFNKPFIAQSLCHAKQKFWLIFAAGLLTGFCYSIKFSSAIVFAVYAFPLLFTLTGRAWRQSAAAYLLGLTASMIVTYACIINPLELWTNTHTFMDFQAQHHGLHSSLIVTYWNSICAAFNYFQPYLIPLIVVTFGASYFIGSQRKTWANGGTWRTASISLQAGVWTALTGLALATNCLHQTWDTGNIFFAITLIIFCEALGVYLGLGKNAEQKFSWRALILQFVVCLLPVLCSVGTSNSLPLQCAVFMAPTFLLLFGLSVTLNNQLGTILPGCLALSLCSILSAFQFYDGFVRHPYDLAESLKAQSRKVECLNLKGLRMSAGEGKFIEDTQKILGANGFKEGDDILAFYQLPGLVYAVGGSSPGIGWYSPLLPSAAWNRHCLKNLTVSDQKNLFLIVDRRLDDGILSGLKERGVSFPDNFQLVGSTYNPRSLGTIEGVPDMNGKTDIYKRSVRAR